MGKVQQESVQMSVVALMEDPTKEAQEKLDSLQQIMPLIEENAMGLSEETERIFLRLFQVDEEVAKKVEMLAALDPYKIGVRGVIRLVEIIRQNAQAFVEKTQKALVERYGIDEYYGIFGTGGDKGKGVKLNTLNISTLAGIIAGSVRDERGKTLFPIVKVGSLAVTSNIGACNFMQALYPYRVDEEMLARQVARFGFAFLSPGSLGLPYSDNLMQARKRIFASGICDIVKIVVPSACLMDPSAQLTGVSDMRMLPFILAVFRHLMHTSRLKKGFIVHSYSGVDELHNQSVLIEVEPKFPKKL